MEWIEEIKKLRDERGLSDAEVGAELGMSKQFTLTSCWARPRSE